MGVKEYFIQTLELNPRFTPFHVVSVAGAELEKYWNSVIFIKKSLLTNFNEHNLKFGGFPFALKLLS